jgi:hypothetical protein
MKWKITNVWKQPTVINLAFFVGDFPGTPGAQHPPGPDSRWNPPDEPGHWRISWGFHGISEANNILGIS